MYTDVLMPVELLSAGEWAEVVEVTGEPHCVHRLAEMGVQAGCRVRVLQPGVPCLLQVGSDLGTKLLNSAELPFIP